MTAIRTRCFVTAVGILLAFPSVIYAQLALNQRLLVVYNSANSASIAVANYYASQRSIPAANLCPINLPSTTSLTWSQHVSSVKTPIRNCLTTIGPQNIL